jgi:hypothetical protein
VFDQVDGWRLPVSLGAPRLLLGVGSMSVFYDPHACLRVACRCELRRAPLLILYEKGRLDGGPVLYHV